MRTKVVEYWNGTTPVAVEGEEKRQPDIRIVVRDANVLVGIRRSILQGLAETWLKAQGYVSKAESEGEGEGEGEGEAETEKAPASLTAIAARITARVVYPDLVATIVDAQGIDPDISLDEFLDLPDSLTGPWQDAVYELNSHWLPSSSGSPAEAEAEKKD